MSVYSSAFLSNARDRQVSKGVSDLVETLHNEICLQFFNRIRSLAICLKCLSECGIILAHLFNESFGVEHKSLCQKKCLTIFFDHFPVMTTHLFIYGNLIN